MLSLNIKHVIMFQTSSRNTDGIKDVPGWVRCHHAPKSQSGYSVLGHGGGGKHDLVMP